MVYTKTELQVRKACFMTDHMNSQSLPLINKLWEMNYSKNVTTACHVNSQSHALAPRLFGTS